MKTWEILFVIGMMNPIMWAFVNMSEKHQRSAIAGALWIIAAAIWRLK